MSSLRPPTLPDRFWAKVDIPIHAAGCWEWTGSRNLKGYGRISGDGRRGGIFNAHRVAYALLVGPIPSGLVIDHLCRSRGCVNPLHLEAVTAHDNARRGSRAGQTHCIHGHEYTPANTYQGKRGRQCVSCRRGGLVSQ